MKRVIILGRGGAGKSVLAREIGTRTGLPVVELDKEFWSETLEALPNDVWADRQTTLAAADRWVMDGDLGPYDVLEPRLRRADTIVMLDLPLLLCAWRAFRRSRQRMDFWVWTARWRRVNRPSLLDAVARSAPDADLIVLTSRGSVRRWLADLPVTGRGGTPPRP